MKNKRKYDTGCTSRLEIRCNPDFKVLVEKFANVFNCENTSEFMNFAVMMLIGDLEGSIVPCTTLQDICDFPNSDYELRNDKIYSHFSGQICEVIFIGNIAYIYKSLKS